MLESDIGIYWIAGIGYLSGLYDCKFAIKSYSLYIPWGERTVSHALWWDKPMLLPARHVYQPDWLAVTLCSCSISGFNVTSSLGCKHGQEHRDITTILPMSTQLALRLYMLRRKRRPTNCNECWTPQPVLSAVPTSSTEACRDSSILSYNGWMFPSESCTSSASWCSTACTVKRLRTLWNCANQSQVLHHGNISDPPPDSSWSYRVTDSAFMADGLSVWLVRRSGIPRRTASGIRLLAGTVSDNLRRIFCSQRTDAFSALEVSRWSRRCDI